MIDDVLTSEEEKLFENLLVALEGVPPFQVEDLVERLYSEGKITKEMRDIIVEQLPEVTSGDKMALSASQSMKNLVEGFNGSISFGEDNGTEHVLTVGDDKIKVIEDALLAIVAAIKE